jgi:prepilin-type processing-associated H-X9-DG protein
VLIAVITLTIVLLAVDIQVPVGGPHGPGLCGKKLNTYYLGIHFYLSSYGDFLPLAWLESGRPDDRLGKLSYWRLSIQDQAAQGLKRMSDGDAQVAFRPEETAKAKLESNKLFWSDAVKGYTKDYFGPSLLFRGFMDPGTMEIDTTKHDSDRNPYDKHARYTEIINRDCPSSQRPVLADVDASYPNPDVTERETKNKDLNSGHALDLSKGWTVARVTAPADARDIDLFIGVGRSLRVYKETDADYGLANSRFDFRHNGSVNVLFLDGHVMPVKDDDLPRLQAIHDAWNKLVPKAESAVPGQR